MDSHLISTMSINVLGGLAIFLLGMHNMSNGLQTIAGSRMRALIGAVTNNRFMATFIGIFVTCIIQSSSVTTVMVVGFVNSSLMNLTQALGVIMGANIGTTITGWVLVLKIGKFGLPILAISTFFFLFSKNERLRYIAMAIMGIGMIFYGLEMMKNGFKPIREIPQFEAWFIKFTADNYFNVLRAALVGCLLTLIVQSSSATLGITIGLASTGVIHYQTAAALILGENIGTTITAFLASFNANTNARRAAYGHIIFNVLGVLWITAIFPIYILIIKAIVGNNPDTMIMVDGAETYPYIRAAIALTHTCFNIANTLLFIPLLPFLAKFLIKIVPDKPFKETPKLTKLDFRLIDTPAIAIEQSRNEILRMGTILTKLFTSLKDSTNAEILVDSGIEKMFEQEEELDSMQEEITTFLMDIIALEIPLTLSKETRAQLRVTDEYESISDYIVANLKLRLKLRDANMLLTVDEKNELNMLHDKIVNYFNIVNRSFKDRNEDIITTVHAEGASITHLFRELRQKHMSRLEKKKLTPLMSVTYINMLNNYRKVKDHIENVAESFCC